MDFDDLFNGARKEAPPTRRPRPTLDEALALDLDDDSADADATGATQSKRRRQDAATTERATKRARRDEDGARVTATAQSSRTVLQLDDSDSELEVKPAPATRAKTATAADKGKGKSKGKSKSADALDFEDEELNALLRDAHLPVTAAVDASARSGATQSLAALTCARLSLLVALLTRSHHHRIGRPHSAPRRFALVSASRRRWARPALRPTAVEVAVI